jgi:hypothetical protein
MPNKPEWSLFDAPEPPSVAVDTSEAAADSLKGTVSRLRREVLAAVVAAGMVGLTCEELCKQTRLAANTARPRLWELEGMGYIAKSGTKRRTHSGRQARAYVATSVGAAALDHG